MDRGVGVGVVSGGNEADECGVSALVRCCWRLLMANLLCSSVCANGNFFNHVTAVTLVNCKKGNQSGYSGLKANAKGRMISCFVQWVMKEKRCELILFLAKTIAFLHEEKISKRKKKKKKISNL
jgi:hypothetical protein